jgi:signal transduction histidine kinase
MKDKLFNTLYSEWKEALGESLYESKSLFIAVFSADGKLMVANKTMTDLFRGEPSESLLNPTFEKLVSMPAEKPLIYEGYLTMGEQICHFTSILAKIFRKEDKLLIVGGVDVSQMVEQNGAMHQLNDNINNLQRQLIKEKITLENTYKQLNLANANLREANATKDKFLSIMAHDLKNPFAILLGFSDILLENLSQFSNEEILQQIEVINKTVHKTYGLLEDLLLWSRSQLGRIEYYPTEVQLEAICKGVASGLSELSDRKNIHLNVRVSPDIKVLVDENMTRTILRNLITNAIKFSWHDSDVSVTAEDGAEMVTVYVIDQGVGIKPEMQQKIWKLSEQVSTEGTDKEEGSGLGLLLCKEFTEKQGGTIFVDSEPGKGSVFSFTLPKASI